MSPPADQAQSIDAWDGYWRHTGEAAGYRAGGRHEPLLALFWADLFAELLRGAHPLSILDVACGNGAALGYLFRAAGSRGTGADGLFAVGLDGSVAALANLHRRLPRVIPVGADARNPPFADHAFDIVISQFGIEYGGGDAVVAAARLVRPGGTFAAIMHMKDGGIYRECATNLRVIDIISRFLPPARAALLAAIDAGQGRGPREALQQADRALAAEASELERAFTQLGREVTGGFAFRLYQDIGHIYRNAARFAGSDVASWLDRMGGEVATYRERMAAMLGAALGEPQYNALAARLTESGMTVRRRETLGLGDAGSAGWILVAQQPKHSDQ